MQCSGCFRIAAIAPVGCESVLDRPLLVGSKAGGICLVCLPGATHTAYRQNQLCGSNRVNAMTPENLEEMWKAIEPVAKQNFFEGFRAGEASGYLKGLEAGYLVGHQEGKQEGFELALDVCKPAVSDGLRHGSPVCGYLMQTFKQDLPDYVTDEEFAEELLKEM